MYILLFVLAIGVYVIYIDSIYLYNAKKIILASKENIELVSFSKIKENIITENSFLSKLTIINGEVNLQLTGFDNIPIHNKSILKRGSIHPSQQLALYSMAYATDYLISKTYVGKLTVNDVEILNKTYLFVNNEILNFMSLNNMTVNDHAISERVQFVLLYLSYLSEFEPSQQLLIEKLQKDLNICVGFLVDSEHFTWQTNHGIMQLRAIAQIADFTTDEKLKLQLLKVFEERLNLVIPFFIGADGAIYESASGYWKYIYSQFLKLTQINSVKELPCIINLKARLEKSAKFIDIVTTNDGFLQGLGDSYSSINNKRMLNVNNVILTNRRFCFSNQLAGYNWNVDSICLSILFVSLHTPPNVHKFPEDLAVYLYSNGPFFSNTGIYSYAVSDTRSFFDSEQSQSTVILKNNVSNLLKKSFIYPQYTDGKSNYVFIGKKIYQNSDTIVRILNFSAGYSFQINDASSLGSELISSFNLHPTVSIETINDTTLTLINQGNIRLKLVSNHKITLKKTMISERFNQTTTVNRIEIVGRDNITKFSFPDLQKRDLSSISFVDYLNADKCDERFEISQKLVEKYQTNFSVQRNFKAVFINSLAFTFFIYILLIVFIELNYRKRAHSK